MAQQTTELLSTVGIYPRLFCRKESWIDLQQPTALSSPVYELSRTSPALEQAEEGLEVWEKLRDDVQDKKTAYGPKMKSAKRERNADTSSSRKRSRMDDSDDDFVDDNSDSVDDEVNDASNSDGHSEDKAQSPLTKNECCLKSIS
jgi:hypothetical protein